MSMKGNYEILPVPWPDRAEFEKKVWEEREKNAPSLNHHTYLQGAIAGFRIAKELAENMHMMPVEEWIRRFEKWTVKAGYSRWDCGTMRWNHEATFSSIDFDLLFVKFMDAVNVGAA